MIVSKLNDIYGEVTLSEDVTWKANTQRSLMNFPIGVEKMPEPLIKALINVKKSAALANAKLGKLREEEANLIVNACDSLLETDFMKHFPLSIWQTGSGTQTNMNANEVISTFCSYDNKEIAIHPNDHVNAGQSTNDVFPTAMHVMAVDMIENELLPEMNQFMNTLKAIEKQYETLIKVGRTHLQDATPLTFGNEVGAWRFAVQENIKHIESSLYSLKQLAIGGTAVGTGLNSVLGFDKEVVDNLSNIYNIKFECSENKYHAMSFKDAFTYSHGALNTFASDLLKIVDDIRYLSSGPRAGLREIEIPANEAGSSIMPGKVNPTQAEAVSMVCAQVMGNHQTITFSSSQGRFQLNAFMPVIVQNFWQSVRLLTDACASFRERCLVGLKANEKVMTFNLEHSLMTATYLNTKFGYDLTSEIVKEAHEKDTNIKEIVVQRNLMSAQEFDEFFDYKEMIKPKEAKNAK